MGTDKPLVIFLASACVCVRSPREGFVASIRIRRVVNLRIAGAMATDGSGTPVGVMGADGSDAPVVAVHTGALFPCVRVHRISCPSEAEMACHERVTQ